MGIIGADVEVVSGKDGWLFLSVAGADRFLEAASDLSSWRKNTLPKHVANFRARHKRMADRGIPFVVMLAPEAYGIYPEFLPDSLTVETPTIGELLADRLVQEGIDAFCPSETLRRAKGPIDLYCRTDSHWSFSGAYIAYRMLMDRVKRRVPVNEVAPLSFELRTSRTYGDLGVHVDPERTSLIEKVAIDGYDTVAYPTLSDFRDKTIKRFKCSQGQSRALIFRDSFANALSPFLERTFAETIMIASTPVLLDEAIDYYNPDIVIMEIAERSLCAPEDPFNDWPTRSFSQDYLETATNPSGARHQVEAVRAIRSNDFDRGLINAAVGVALSEGGPRVYNLAWALNSVGARSEARLLARTFAKKTNDRFLHYVDADAAYHASDMQGALKAIDEALELQPNHGFFLFLKGAWLHIVEPTEEAARIMEKSLIYAPIHLHSWKWLIDIYTKLGRNDDARRTRARAAALFPEATDETWTPVERKPVAPRSGAVADLVHSREKGGRVNVVLADIIEDASQNILSIPASDLSIGVGQRLSGTIETTATAGCLSYGPYVNLEPGVYTAQYVLASHRNVKGISVDVIGDFGDSFVAVGKIDPGDVKGGSFAFTFRVAKVLSNAEFRVFVTAQTKIELSRIVLTMH